MHPNIPVALASVRVSLNSVAANFQNCSLIFGSSHFGNQNLPPYRIIIHKLRALPPHLENCHQNTGWSCSLPYMQLNKAERLMRTEAWLDGCIQFKVPIRSPCIFSQCLWNFQPSNQFTFLSVPVIKEGLSYVSPYLSTGNRKVKGALSLWDGCVEQALI